MDLRSGAGSYIVRQGGVHKKRAHDKGVYGA